MQLSARAPSAAGARRADLSACRPSAVTAAAAGERQRQRLRHPVATRAASPLHGPSSSSSEEPADRDVTTSAVSAAAASAPTTTSASDFDAAVQQRAILAERAAARRAQRRAEQLGYQVSAVAASVGVTSIAVVATYYKFSREVSLIASRAAASAQQAALDAGASADAALDAARAAADAAPFPWLDMAGTLALVVGGVVGMEMWARWAHKALWHDAPAGWALHKSHHEPRVGPFEANDLFAVINAAPAFGLCLYGFLTPGMPGSLSFGAGLGITLFGIMYMFVHDGLVHRRFPVGPIARLPYMKRLVVAHRLHHSEKYQGVPWGLFLGPQELEAIGAGPELDALVSALDLTDVGGSGAAEPAKR
jgi:beta-carotene 3-hydroxylase